MKYTIDVNPQIISAGEFRDLLETRESHCISIYIPTQREGREVQEELGPKKLKNSLKKIRKELEQYGLTENEAKEYLEPLEDLQEDPEFWRNQSDCLALFKANDELKIFTLPIKTEQQTYVSDHFFVLPIFPFFNVDGRFYILTLTQQEVKFYEATHHSITPIKIDDLAPERLEDAVGYDYREKSLQFRSGQGGKAGAMFHGQGSGKDDRNKELEKFFRAVDTGIQEYLTDKNDPLVLACVEEYFPMYDNVTRHSNLWKAFIRGNPEETDPLLLQEEGWLLVEPFFLRDKKRQIDRFRQLSATGKTSFELEDIIPSAIDGRIDVLFVRNDTDRFGLYDKVNRSLIIDQDRKPYHASLYNMASVHTWMNGGQVYLVSPGEMPLKGTTINALYRY
jgi:hypothetical protein